MAMDHRASFGKTLFDVRDDHPDDAQRAAMKSAKQLIFEGLQEAVPMLTSGRAGVLVDERYRQGVIDQVAAGKTPVVLAVPVEASGHQDRRTLPGASSRTGRPDGNGWLSGLGSVRGAQASPGS